MDVAKGYLFLKTFVVAGPCLKIGGPRRNCLVSFESKEQPLFDCGGLV